MHQKPANAATIQRLTALWALGESGLGGWMHALKIPLTGIFVGGFAIIIISLLAHYSRNNYRQMMQATLLVILVKFAVSPQSPPPAYLAVGFQGLAGAVLYNIIPNFRVASVIFGAIAMLESAVQKILVLTIIYGTALWEALNKFFAGIVKDFGLGANTSFSFQVIATYVGVYALWGLILGIWMGALPQKIALQSATIRQKTELHPAAKPPAAPGKRSKQTKIALYIILLGFIVWVLLLDGSTYRALYVIIRTIAIILLFYTIINPVIKWWLSKRLENSSRKNQKALQEILALMPEMRSLVSPAYAIAAEKHRGFKRYPTFLFILIVLTLQPPDKHA